MTQPAVSRQVQTLERQLGVPLFERNRRAVVLTEAGRQLLQDAVGLLAYADATSRRVQRIARGGNRLVVGFRSGLTLTSAIRRFSDVQPDVTIETRRIEWDEQESALLGGQVDIAYVRRPIDEQGLELIPLFTEPRLAALPVRHPLAYSRSLTVAEIASERHLRYLESAGAGTTRAPLRSVEEKLEFVASGEGIIVLPQSATIHYTRPDITYVPLSDAEPDEVLLAWPSSRRSQLLTIFIDSAKSAILSTDPAGISAEGMATHL